MNKLVTFLLILTMSVSVFGQAAVKRVWLKKNGFIRMEGATDNEFELVLTNVDPTADRAQQFQDADGIIALLADTSSIFPSTGEVHVNAENVADAEEDGSFEHPFDLIAEGITASSAGNLLIVATGNYPEALVIPHDLFIHANSATGVTAIDISSGSLTGRIHKWEFHGANGLTIHPDNDDVENGSCLIIAHATGSTTAAAFSINTLPGTYDMVAALLDLWANVNARNNSFAGIGAPAAIIITTNTTCFRDYTANNFTNLDIQNGVGSSIFSIIARSGEDCSGSIKNVKASGVFRVTQGAGKTTGDHEHVAGYRWMVSGTIKNESKMLDISAINRMEFIAGNTKAIDITACPATVIFKGVFDGAVIVRDADSIITAAGGSVTFTGGLKLAGVITQDAATDVGIYDGGYMSNSTHETTSASKRAEFGSDILTNAFRISTSRLFYLGGVGAEATIVESSVSVRYTDLRYTLLGQNPSSGGIEFLGSYDFCDIEGATGALGVAVSTGAKVRHCNFHGFDSTVNAAIRGQNLLANYGATTFPTYFFTPNTLVYPLLKQPNESDGVGGRVAIADLTVFKQTIYLLANQAAPVAGEELSNLEGFMAEMQLVQDNPDDFGFGAGTWVIITTATDAAAIDALLSAPTGNLVSSTDSEASITGKAATGIDLTGTSLGGGFVGQEITVIGEVKGTKTVVLDSDDTVIRMTGVNTLRLDSDNATGSNRTLSFELASLVEDQIYTIYFLDNGFEAEWIDGGADGARLNATITFTDDDTVQFIYDGTDIRQLSGSTN